MLSYDKLVAYLKYQNKYLVTIKPQYLVIKLPNYNYHITIFRDQWNTYESVAKKPYHLFHISSDTEINRCSTYFWVDNKTGKIKNIPEKDFAYNQLEYNFFSSTRSPCSPGEITKILKKFQNILLDVIYY